MGPCLLLYSQPGRFGAVLREESAAWVLREETGLQMQGRGPALLPSQKETRSRERGYGPRRGDGALLPGVSLFLMTLSPALLLGKRKIHYQFEDGKEMAEEYNMKTGQLVSKWSGRSVFAGLEWWKALSGQEGSAPKYSRKNCSWSSHSLLKGHNCG